MSQNSTPFSISYPNGGGGPRQPPEKCRWREQRPIHLPKVPEGRWKPMGKYAKYPGKPRKVMGFFSSKMEKPYLGDEIQHFLL